MFLNVLDENGISMRLINADAIVSIVPLHDGGVRMTSVDGRELMLPHLKYDLLLAELKLLSRIHPIKATL